MGEYLVNKRNQGENLTEIDFLEYLVVFFIEKNIGPF